MPFYRISVSGRPISLLATGSWASPLPEQAVRSMVGRAPIVKWTVGTSERTVGTSERTVRTGERTAHSLERTAQTVERTAQTMERTAQTVERTAQASERTAHSQGEPAPLRERTAQTTERTVHLAIREPPGCLQRLISAPHIASFHGSASQKPG